MNLTARLGAAAVAGVISLAVPAAMVPAPAAATAQGGCGQVTHWTSKFKHNVRVSNKCNYSISYQIKRRGPDSDCMILSAYASRTSWWQRYGRQFQGIRWNCA
ncbi:hypothetical protein [Nonomuraea fuscirosea]|uniref:hypothetical protein n=1 Tax=Nonomuraea fuscirosea TaxID=1291556 RepID=UPI00342F4551